MLMFWMFSAETSTSPSFHQRGLMFPRSGHRRQSLGFRLGRVDVLDVLPEKHQPPLMFFRKTSTPVDVFPENIKGGGCLNIQVAGKKASKVPRSRVDVLDVLLEKHQRGWMFFQKTSKGLDV